MAEMQNKKLSNIFFYGVSYIAHDKIDVTRDIITNIRKRFLVTKKPASNKLYRTVNDMNYMYSYNFSFNQPLKWRVTCNKRVIEEIVRLQADKYLINYYDSNGKDIKKVFFDSKHRWFKTNYYNPVSNDNLISTLVPKEFDEGTSILKYVTGDVYPVRLFSCNLPSCDEVRMRVLSRIPTPQITAVTDRGIMYFLPEDEKDEYERILLEEEDSFAKENGPQVYITKEDVTGGFNLSPKDFDMSKNLNRTFDISLAQEFSGEDKATAPVIAEDVVVSKKHPATGSYGEVKLNPSAETVEDAISDMVEQINSRTSLDINAEDILSFEVYNEEESPAVDVLKEDVVTFETTEPTIDEQIEHIDSVLDGTSLLSSDRKLIIGDSVVDEDYISSIIDGIMASAFSTGSNEEHITDEFEDVSDYSYSDDSADSDDEINLPEYTEDTQQDNAQEPFFVNIPVDADVVPVADIASVTTDSVELTKEPEVDLALEDDIPDNAAGIEEDSEAVINVNPETDSENNDESETEIESEIQIDSAEKSDVDSVNEADVEIVTETNPLESYAKVNKADSVVESRGETYVYYGALDENGRRNGRGRTLMADGSIAYEGEYREDKRNGQGSFYFKDGTLCYWGDWTDNVRRGFGVGVSSEEKAVHIGKWNDNKPSGIGARFDNEGNLMFISSSCDDKKKGFTISDLSDTSFTVRVWDEKADAFIQREFSVDDFIK